MKYFFACCLLLILLTNNEASAWRFVKSVNITDSLIAWRPDYKLTFDDFEDRYKFSCDFDETAATYFMIEVDYEISDGSVILNIVATFNRRQSFIKISDSILLRHEQLHFDIAEKYARRLRSDLLRQLAISHLKTEKVESVIHDNLIMSRNSCKSEQNEYDSQTNHGKNLKYQLIWEKKISKAILSFNRYASYTVTVKF